MRNAGRLSRKELMELFLYMIVQTLTAKTISRNLLKRSRRRLRLSSPCASATSTRTSHKTDLSPDPWKNLTSTSAPAKTHPPTKRSSKPISQNFLKPSSRDRLLKRISMVATSETKNQNNLVSRDKITDMFIDSHNNCVVNLNMVYQFQNISRIENNLMI